MLQCSSLPALRRQLVDDGESLDESSLIAALHQRRRVFSCRGSARIERSCSRRSIMFAVKPGSFCAS